MSRFFWCAARATAAAAPASPFAPPVVTVVPSGSRTVPAAVEVLDVAALAEIVPSSCDACAKSDVSTPFKVRVSARHCWAPSWLASHGSRTASRSAATSDAALAPFLDRRARLPGLASPPSAPSTARLPRPLLDVADFLPRVRLAGLLGDSAVAGGGCVSILFSFFLSFSFFLFFPLPVEVYARAHGYVWSGCVRSRRDSAQRVRETEKERKRKVSPAPSFFFFFLRGNCMKWSGSRRRSFRVVVRKRRRAKSVWMRARQSVALPSPLPFFLACNRRLWNEDRVGLGRKPPERWVARPWQSLGLAAQRIVIPR